MKKSLALKTLACWLLSAATSLAVDSNDPQLVRSTFEGAAPHLTAQHPWDNGGVATPTEQQALRRLEQLADQIMQLPGAEPTMLALLDEYRNQDGYHRQKLIRAILNYPKYKVGDLPFLKSVYLASLDFHYDQYPSRVRNWLTPFAIRYHLADMILALKSQGNLADSPDVGLISTDPAAWISKYAR